MEPLFDHEKLVVYRQAIQFVAWWEERSRCCGRLYTIRDQLDRASTSVPLNIAEGNAKLSPRDRSRFLQIATGSALEGAACLDVLVARGKLTSAAAQEGKALLRGVVSMLVALTNRLADRVTDDTPAYDYVASEEV